MATVSKRGGGQASDSDAAIVNQLLRKLRPGSGATTWPAPGSDVVRADRPGLASGPRPFRLAPAVRPAAVWLRVALGVLLAVALPQWSYAHACGAPLALYLAVVGLLVVTGGWAAVFAWRGRVGLAHVIALIAILWGLVLTTHEILPRVGYARTHATWRCWQR